ncbi:Mg(2+)/citrate complex secondary transporter [Clavibacter michiganensis]|uniref:Mg(2+)/citrate complex secondary transporter n=1 Tax=Clavibacter michiganensis TaxID=28447 RepID=A0A251XXY8_9MICO|nr:Mg(2+)/citrate complex secondary transporter [Clavibacter michiganensis]
MLVFLGFAMVLTFMALIMTKRLTPMVALILVPTIFGLFAGPASASATWSSRPSATWPPRPPC